MNAWELLTAMNGASDADLEAVERRLGLTKGRSIRRAGMRILLAAAVTAALLIATLGIAMAASPEFRETVYSIFRIQTREPAIIATDKPEHDVQRWQHLELEDAAEIDYYTLRAPFMLIAEDTFYHWDETGGCFYQLIDGDFEEIPATRVAFDITFGGAEQHIVYDWAKRDGKYLLGYQEDTRADENPYGYEWMLTQPEPKSGTAFLILPDWTRGFAQIPFLLDLESGTWQEALPDAPMPEAAAPEISTWRISADQRYMLLCDWEGGAWLFDRNTKEMTNLSDLASGAMLYAAFIDPETLLFATRDYNNIHYVWYDVTDGATEVRDYPEEEIWSLVAPFKGKALTYDDDGTCILMDLRTGIGTPLPVDLERFPCLTENPAGTKLHCVDGQIADDTARGTTHIYNSFAVIDLEHRTIVQLDREQNTDTDEYMLGWLDNDRFAVWCENPAAGFSDVHVYRLHEPNQ